MIRRKKKKNKQKELHSKQKEEGKSKKNLRNKNNVNEKKSIEIDSNKNLEWKRKDATPNRQTEGSSKMMTNSLTGESNYLESPATTPMI